MSGDTVGGVSRIGGLSGARALAECVTAAVKAMREGGPPVAGGSWSGGSSGKRKDGPLPVRALCSGRPFTSSVATPRPSPRTLDA